MGWIRTVVISAVLGALTVVGVTAIGATAAGRLIEACVHRSNGNVRIVAANQSCRNSEVPLTWNQKGPAGATGPAGPKGDRGPQGPTGAAGPAGPKGETGPLGPVGPQGPAGAQGIPGEAGPQGPQGAQGVQGETGPAGPQGEKGETGPAGPQGETGPQGPQGEKGDMGPVGPAGPEGEAGPQGPQGPPGPAGGGAAISFITRSITSISVPRNTTDYQRSIACSDGEVVVGGGFSTNNNVEVYRSMPNTMNGWSVLFKNPTNTLYGASIYVICADMP